MNTPAVNQEKTMNSQQPPIIAIPLLPEEQPTGVLLENGQQLTPIYTQIPEHKITIVFKLFEREPEEKFMIATARNVLIPHLDRLWESTEILALHQKIKLGIKKFPNVAVEFQFYNK